MSRSFLFEPLRLALEFPHGLFIPLGAFLLLCAPDEGGAAEAFPPQWIARYDGPDHGFDQAHAIAAFPGGGVVVVGESDTNGTEEDLFLVRYDTDGAELWSVRYDGPGNGVDRGLAVAADEAGNVYVTGQSWGTEASEYDIVTLKCDANGTLQWPARYDGPGESWDRGTAIATGLAGEVYVTGWATLFTDGINSSVAFVTISYDAVGSQRWVDTYTGPGTYDQDRAVDVAVDRSGDVYVTGESYGFGTAWDYATLKYRGTDGALLWAARYDFGVSSIDGASALALDEIGNVYVAGYSYVDAFDGTKSDVLTVKYDPSGNQVWASRYDGPVGSYDGGADVAVHGDAVIVTGQSVGAGTESDYVTIKYGTETGATVWTRRYNGPQNAGDYGMHVALDTAGNVYVTGESKFVSVHADIVTIKYDPDGEELWCDAHSTPANTNDFSRGIAVDLVSNAYICGTSSYVPEGVSWDAVVLEYAGATTSAPSELAPARASVWPNPSNGPMGIAFELSEASRAELDILDVGGRRIRRLADEMLPGGIHERSWDARNDFGEKVPAGYYFYRLRAGAEESTGRLVQLK